MGSSSTVTEGARSWPPRAPSLATLLSPAQVTARAGLIAHVVPGRAEVEARLVAMQRALGALDAMVNRRATVLAFEKVFLLAGILFLFVTPLLMFLKAPNDLAAATK